MSLSKPCKKINMNSHNMKEKTKKRKKKIKKNNKKNLKKKSIIQKKSVMNSPENSISNLNKKKESDKK